MLEVEGADKFGVLAKALRTLGEKDLQKQLYAGINRAVKPLTAAVKSRANTARYVPSGYATELSKTLRVRAKRRAGRNPRITLVGTAKTRQGAPRKLDSLNRGRMRHPLYGNRGYWFNQDEGIKKGFWDEPLRDNAGVVRKEIVKALNEAAIDLAKKL